MKDAPLPWYTLAVVDEDGSITGQRGTTIAPSRHIEVVDDWQDALIGQAVRTRHLPYVPAGDTVRLVAETFMHEDDFLEVPAVPPMVPPEMWIKTFQRCYLAHKPTHRTERRKAIEAWERIE